MKCDFNELRHAVEVSNNLRNIEHDIYYSFRPLGKYYGERNDKEKEYDEKVMKIRNDLINFRMEFEAQFMPECSQPQQV